MSLTEAAEAHSSGRGGEYITATAKLESTHPECPGWRAGTLAISAELESAFGVQSIRWLSSRCKTVVREHVARKYAQQITPSASFTFTLDPESRSSQPARGSILVVLAPVEHAIAHSIQATKSSSGRDYWNALAKVAAMLLRCRQPLGDSLRDWAAGALDGQLKVPDGRKSAQWTDDSLRAITISEAVYALRRCRMPVTMDGRLPGPACEAVANAFSLSEARVLDIWKACSR